MSMSPRKGIRRLTSLFALCATVYAESRGNATSWRPPPDQDAIKTYSPTSIISDLKPLTPNFPSPILRSTTSKKNGNLAMSSSAPTTIPPPLKPLTPIVLPTRSVPHPTSSRKSGRMTTSRRQGAYKTAAVPLYLYSMVEALIRDMPSSAPTKHASLTMPTKLVIGTATYEMNMEKSDSHTTKPSSSLSRASPSNPARSSANKSHVHDQENDKRLGIVLGVVIGSIAIAMMAILFWCLARRKTESGSFFMRRSSPSVSSRGSQRFGGCGVATLPIMSQTNSTKQYDDHGAALLRPSLHEQRSSDSGRSYRPFYTPLEHPSALQGSHDRRKSLQQGSASVLRDARPSMPFSPDSIRQTNKLPRRPVPQSSTYATANRQGNKGLVSPISPSDSTAMPRWPSLDEVSDFDFVGNSATAERQERSMAWQPANERVHGRHEIG